MLKSKCQMSKYKEGKEITGRCVIKRIYVYIDMHIYKFYIYVYICICI